MNEINIIKKFYNHVFNKTPDVELIDGTYIINAFALTPKKVEILKKTIAGERYITCDGWELTVTAIIEPTMFEPQHASEDIIGQYVTLYDALGALALHECNELIGTATVF
jgi:hypothetical protein